MAAIRGDPNYQVSSRMLLKLLRKGWIERRAAGTRLARFALTAAGREAISAKVRVY